MGEVRTSYKSGLYSKSQLSTKESQELFTARQRKTRDIEILIINDSKLNKKEYPFHVEKTTKVLKKKSKTLNW